MDVEVGFLLVGFISVVKKNLRFLKHSFNQSQSDFRLFFLMSVGGINIQYQYTVVVSNEVHQLKYFLLSNWLVLVREIKYNLTQSKISNLSGCS